MLKPAAPASWAELKKDLQSKEFLGLKKGDRLWVKKDGESKFCTVLKRKQGKGVKLKTGKKTFYVQAKALIVTKRAKKAVLRYILRGFYGRLKTGVIVARSDGSSILDVVRLTGVWHLAKQTRKRDEKRRKGGYTCRDKHGRMQKLNRNDVLPLPYGKPYDNKTCLPALLPTPSPRLYFPKDTAKNKLLAAIRAQDSKRVNAIVNGAPYRRDKPDFVALTSHQPNSIAYILFKECGWSTIWWALHKFDILPNRRYYLHSLCLGPDGLHFTEVLVKRGAYDILGFFAQIHGLKSLFGQNTGCMRNRIRQSVKFHFLLTAAVGPLQRLNQALVLLANLGALDWSKVQREDGATALQLAIDANLPHNVRALLNAGAPVDQKGWMNDTALVFALNHEASDEIVQILVNAGADLSLRSGSGQTPQQLLAKREAARV